VAPITLVRPILPFEESRLDLFGLSFLFRLTSSFQLKGIDSVYPETNFVRCSALVELISLANLSFID